MQQGCDTNFPSKHQLRQPPSTPASGGQGGGVEEADDPAYAGQAAANKVRQKMQLGMSKFTQNVGDPYG